MKTHTGIFYGALLGVLILATPLAAQARPFGHGYGPGNDDGGPRGYGWHQRIPEDKQDAVWKMMREHRDKVQPLRDQLWVKSRTLDALSGNPNVQPKEVEALAAEVAALRTQLRDSHKAFADKVRSETGVDMPGGGYCGMMGDGPQGGYGGGYGHHGGRGGHGGGHGGRR